MENQVMQSIEASGPPKVAGSTWVTLYNGRDWPVVLCDKHTTPEKFLLGRHQDEVPGILLGKHKYVWVFLDQLTEFVPHANYSERFPKFDQPEIQKYDNDYVKTEKQRWHAFTRDAMHFEDDKFWYNCVIQKSTVRKLENERNRRPSIRSQPPKARGVKRKFNLEDDGISIVEDNQRQWTSALASRSCDDGRKDSVMAGQDQYPTPEDTPVKKRKPSSGYISVYSDDNDAEGQLPAKSNTVSDDRETKSPAATGHRARTEWTPPEMSDDKVKVFVGRSNHGVIIPREALQQCAYLAGLEYFDLQDDFYTIDLRHDERAVERNLTEKEFLRLYDYFHTNDIGPAFLPDKTFDCEEPFGELTDIQKSKLSEQLTLAFATASKIQHAPLQDLIRDKLRGLTPIPPLALLIIATMLSKLPPPLTTSEHYLQEWMVDKVTENMETLQRNHGDILDRKMSESENEPLWQAVFQKLAMASEET